MAKRRLRAWTQTHEDLTAIAAACWDSQGPAGLRATVRCQCRRWDGLPAPVFEGCLALVRDAMRDLYQSSSWGWSEATKRKELADPRMYYLTLEDLQARGFVLARGSRGVRRACTARGRLQWS